MLPIGTMRNPQRGRIDGLATACGADRDEKPTGIIETASTPPPTTQQPVQIGALYRDESCLTEESRIQVLK